MSTIGRTARAGLSGVVGGALGWPMDTLVNVLNLSRAAGGFVGHELGLIDAPPGAIDPADVPGTSQALSRALGVGDSTGEAVAEFAGGFLSPGPKTKTPKTDLFAGKKAKTADLAKLTQAQELEKQGMKRTQIWRQTGWFRGPDKKWRFEIDDSQAMFTPEKALRDATTKHKTEAQRLGDAEKLARSPLNNREGNRYEIWNQLGKDLEEEFFKSHGRAPSKGAIDTARWGVPDNISMRLEEHMANAPTPDKFTSTVGKALTHDELRKSYGGITRDRFSVEDLGPTTRGMHGNNETKLSSSYKSRSFDDALSTMLHEQQHAIQAKEGFSRGGMPSYVTKDSVAWQREVDRQVAPLIERKKKVIKEFEAKKKMMGVTKFDEMEYENRIKELDYYIKDIGLARTRDPSRDQQHDVYSRLAGEAEARAVQRRMNMTPEERFQAVPPWESYDRPWDRLINLKQNEY